jgi:hypothetical protein
MSRLENSSFFQVNELSMVDVHQDASRPFRYFVHNFENLYCFFPRGKHFLPEITKKFSEARPSGLIILLFANSGFDFSKPKPVRNKFAGNNAAVHEQNQSNTFESTVSQRCGIYRSHQREEDSIVAGRFVTHCLAPSLVKKRYTIQEAARSRTSALCTSLRHVG